MATNGNFAQQEQYKAAEQYPAGDADAGNSNLSKDEVGWYFVEQYYTTLSKSPEKLHLFYGKRSQFVYGLEAEVANVSVGRQAIQERIKALDFQDCKVRVSNVDSQASFDNIVIQVIGETSNKGAEPKKFVQTFVLAQQPSGYFVLNDILRYIDEEDEQDQETAAEPAAAPAAEEEPAAEPVAKTEPEAEVTKEQAGKLDADVVDHKLEEVSAVTPAEVKVNGGAAAATPKVTEATPKAEEPSTVDADAAAEEVAEEATTQVEKPKEPAATPVTKAAPTSSEPVMPPKPMTWASRAAAAAGPRPVVPLPKTATPPAQTQTRAPAPAAAAAATATATAPAPAATATTPSAQPTSTTAATTESPAKEASGWQTAGADSKRQNRPQSISANVTEKEGTLGYVKYVTDKVQEADLRNALAAHGELSYFDINRQKNCAFVEYKTVEGYQAAVAANPHVVNGENIVVEPRRPKSAAFGGNNFSSSRGNATGGRGRGGFDGNRTGGQANNSRGNFSGQNRGRGGAARGRGGAQATNA